MGSFNLEASKHWYTDAVVNCLIRSGMTQEEAFAKMQESGYYEKMERFPYVQFHYDVKATADEVLYGDDLCAGDDPPDWQIHLPFLKDILCVDDGLERNECAMFEIDNKGKARHLINCRL